MVCNGACLYLGCFCWLFKNIPRSPLSIGCRSRGCGRHRQCLPGSLAEQKIVSAKKIALINPDEVAFFVEDEVFSFYFRLVAGPSIWPGDLTGFGDLRRCIVLLYVGADSRRKAGEPRGNWHLD